MPQKQSAVFDVAGCKHGFRATIPSSVIPSEVEESLINS